MALRYEQVDAAQDECHCCGSGAVSLGRIRSRLSEADPESSLWGRIRSRPSGGGSGPKMF